MKLKRYLFVEKEVPIVRSIESKYFMACWDKNFGWFRVFGRGIAWKNLAVHPLIFSERNGYTKHLKIGKWSFKYLKP